MIDDGDVVAIGRIGRARGVRGQVFVTSWTDDPEDRFAVGSVIRTDPAERGPLTVVAMSTGGGKLVIHFAGVEDRQAAESLRGTQLVMAAGDRPSLEDPDEFYDSDLVGLIAHTVAGQELGPVHDVVHAGGADYLVLDVAGQEQLIPFVGSIVPTVDIAGGRVVVDPPEGLFEL